MFHSHYQQHFLFVSILYWNLNLTKEQGTGKMVTVFAILRFHYMEALFHISRYIVHYAKDFIIIIEVR